MAIHSEKLDYITGSLQIAEKWRSKGNLVRERRTLSSSMMSILSVATQSFDSSDEACNWLTQQDSLSILSRLCECTNLIASQLDTGTVPASVIGGNYSHLVFAHLSWSLKNNDLGEQFARIALRADVLELSTDFWQAYAIAIQSLIENASYSVGNMNLQGQEIYWVEYLRLIEHITNNLEITAVVAAINESFVRRNRDGSINDDAYEIEGSGNRPTLWDFRRDGLLFYAKGRQ